MIYKKISTGEAYSLSVLARTHPEGRENVYQQIKTSIGSRARKIAQGILKERKSPVRRNGTRF